MQEGIFDGHRIGDAIGGPIGTRLARAFFGGFKKPA